jgi:hypothetical protein
MDELAEIFGKYGLPTALAVFFVYTNWIREKRTLEVLDEQRKFTQERLTELTERSTAAIEKGNENTKVLIELVKSRPCVGELHGGR